MPETQETGSTVIAEMPDFGTSDFVAPPAWLEKVEQAKTNTVAHDRMLGDIPGVQELSAESEDVPDTTMFVFEKDESGIVKPLGFDFKSHGLPEPPEGTVPLLVSITRSEDGTTITGIELISAKERDVERRYLEDPEFTAGDDKLTPRWVYPGYIKHSAHNYEPNIIANNDDVLTIQLDWNDRYSSKEKVPELAHIVRSEPTQRDVMLNDVEGTNRRGAKFKRLRKWFAGVALASSVVGMSHNPGEQYEPNPPISRNYEDFISDNEALNRVEQNIKYFETGDVRSLEKVIAGSEFNNYNHDISFESVKAVYNANSIDEVERLMNDGLSNLQVNFRLDREALEGEYEGLSDKDFKKVQATALGILDGLRFLGPLASGGERFDIEVTGRITAESDLTDKIAGLYIRDGDVPVIRIGVSGQEAVRSTLIHEVMHKLNLTDDFIGSDIDRLDTNDWFEYGPKGSGNGRVGRDSVSSYATSNPDEDIAETAGYVLSGDAKISFENNTLLQEKFGYVIASLEAEYPGVSAYILRHAEKGTPDIDINQEVDATIEKTRRYAHNVLAASVLLLLASQLALKKERGKAKEQYRVGTRS